MADNARGQMYAYLFIYPMVNLHLLLVLDLTQ